MRNKIKYGIKRVWDRRKRWLRERVEMKLPWNDRERAILHPCVAHRGWSGRAPENTMAAFKLALQEPAVQWMELDVHLSRDQIPVVIHDPTLKRTTGVKARVSSMTAEQLAQLDAGSWFSPKFAKERIPTLDQVLRSAKGRCCLNIEIKGEDSAPALIVGRVLEDVRRRFMKDDVIITSFRTDVLKEVREQSRSVRTGLIVDDNPPQLIRTVQSLGCSMLSIGFRHLTERLLQQAAEAGIAVMAWTPNLPADLNRLVRRPEPIMICTNHPDRWLNAIHRQGG